MTLNGVLKYQFLFSCIICIFLGFNFNIKLLNHRIFWDSIISKYMKMGLSRKGVRGIFFCYLGYQPSSPSFLSSSSWIRTPIIHPVPKMGKWAKRGYKYPTLPSETLPIYRAFALLLIFNQVRHEKNDILIKIECTILQYVNEYKV